MAKEIVAELAGVHKRFGKTVALEGFDLSVRAGELLAVLGPNGAGKTTAISILLGLTQPDSGSARLFGLPPDEIAARRRVGVMMQEAALAPELSVCEQIELFASYYDSPMPVAEAMLASHTTSLANRSYGKLSGGQKRQVQFAVALCGRPRLLFLDEPTVGLDLKARELVWETLRALVGDGCGVVLTTHYLEEAEALADRVVVLAKGKTIAAGTVSEIRSLVVRKRIRCRTVLDPAAIASWPDVQSVATGAEGLVLTVSNAENVTRRLLAADDDLQDLEVQRAGLGEAFAELTEQEVAQ